MEMVIVCVFCCDIYVLCNNTLGFRMISEKMREGEREKKWKARTQRIDEIETDQTIKHSLKNDRLRYGVVYTWRVFHAICFVSVDQEIFRPQNSIDYVLHDLLSFRIRPFLIIFRVKLLQCSEFQEITEILYLLLFRLSTEKMSNDDSFMHSNHSSSLSHIAMIIPIQFVLLTLSLVSIAVCFG